MGEFDEEDDFNIVKEFFDEILADDDTDIVFVFNALLLWLAENEFEPVCFADHDTLWDSVIADVSEYIPVSLADDEPDIDENGDGEGAGEDVKDGDELTDNVWGDALGLVVYVLNVPVTTILFDISAVIVWVIVLISDRVPVLVIESDVDTETLSDFVGFWLLDKVVEVDVVFEEDTLALTVNVFAFELDAPPLPVIDTLVDDVLDWLILLETVPDAVFDFDTTIVRLNVGDELDDLDLTEAV